jgi:SAM-dependent methyltransferase
MGYVFDFQDALSYQQWSEQPRTRFSTELEKQLMLEMLNPSPGETLVDIGCGTGSSSNPFVQKGLQVTGVDPSPYMLDSARGVLGPRVTLMRGFAEDLPFEDNSFNHACFYFSLEFVDDPVKALCEACRVTKDRIFFGIINRYALSSIQLRLRERFNQTLFRHARLFSIGEIKNLVRLHLGDVPVTWRTASQFPGPYGSIVQRLKQNNLVQKYPFGAFAGIVVDLVPRFRTCGLPLRLQAKPSTGTICINT